MLVRGGMCTGILTGSIEPRRPGVADIGTAIASRKPPMSFESAWSDERRLRYCSAAARLVSRSPRKPEETEVVSNAFFKPVFRVQGLYRVKGYRVQVSWVVIRGLYGHSLS